MLQSEEKEKKRNATTEMRKKIAFVNTPVDFVVVAVEDVVIIIIVVIVVVHHIRLTSASHVIQAVASINVTSMETKESLHIT